MSGVPKNPKSCHKDKEKRLLEKIEKSMKGEDNPINQPDLLGRRKKS